MSKKQKKTKSAAQQLRAEAANLAQARASAPQIALDSCLRDIDQLCMDKQYILALDRICHDLQRPEAGNVAAVSQYEGRLVTAIRALCDETIVAGDLASLRASLSKASPPTARLVAATWARASAACALFPSSTDLERVLADTIDRGLSATFQRLQIDAKLQHFEKRKILVDELISLERNLTGLVEAPFDLRIVGTVRQSFMRPFKSPLAMEAVWPFLPDHLRSEAQLASLFQSASDLKDAGPDDLMDAFENAAEILRDFTSKADQFGTVYSGKILAKLGCRLQDAIRDYMAESPLAKPACLNVIEIPKKYPLLSAGAKLRVTFQVTNLGPGTAREVLFRVQEIEHTSLKAEKSEWYLGTVGSTALDITVPITVLTPTAETIIVISATWKNFDQSEVFKEFIFELCQQRTDVNWENNLDPFSLEPVDNEAELVGRTDILSELTSLALSKSMGSCYLYGQKRVGKTSVVKTLRDKLIKSGESNRPTVIYLEPGEFRTADPISTIEDLGRTLCRKLRDADGRFAHVEVPIFKGALAPLIEFLDGILRIAPDFRALFVLDEFDALPIGLYKRTEVGDAFFGSLRSVTRPIDLPLA